MTQYVPACRVSDEQLFLPPHRTVGFNAQLTLNDGLLVQSYMQAYDTGYPETVRMIDDAVTDLKRTLQEKGSYELKGIGTLTHDLNGQYNFEPYEAGVLSPDLYGLSSFTVGLVRGGLTTVRNVGIESADDNAEVQPKTKKNYTFSLNRELCNYVAAAVVAVVFYFLWATPVNVGSTGGSVAAFPAMAIPAETPQAADNHTEATNAESNQHEAVAMPEVEAAEAERSSGDFTIVLMSDVPLENAKNYTADLHEKGMTEASVLAGKRMVRVVYGQYADEGEAYAALRTLRKKFEQFGEAWVMALK